ASLGCGRNCLVLTRRVAHVEVLTSLLATRGHQALVLQGGMSVTDRRAAVNGLTDAKAGDGVLVIGTTPFIGAGFDAPALDTLFLAAPVSFDGLLIQCAGRVVRAAPARTSPRSTTTTIGRRRSWPPRCSDACPDTAPSTSAGCNLTTDSFG